MNRVLDLREEVDARIRVHFVTFWTPAKLFPPLANHEEGRTVGFGRRIFVHRWHDVVFVGFNATSATIGSFEHAFLGFGPAWIWRRFVCFYFWRACSVTLALKVDNRKWFCKWFNFETSYLLTRRVRCVGWWQCGDRLWEMQCPNNCSRWRQWDWGIQGLAQMMRLQLNVSHQNHIFVEWQSRLLSVQKDTDDISCLESVISCTAASLFHGIATLEKYPTFISVVPQRRALPTYALIWKIQTTYCIRETFINFYSIFNSIRTRHLPNLHVAPVTPIPISLFCPESTIRISKRKFVWVLTGCAARAVGKRSCSSTCLWCSELYLTSCSLLAKSKYWCLSAVDHLKGVFSEMSSTFTSDVLLEESCLACRDTWKINLKGQNLHLCFTKFWVNI